MKNIKPLKFKLPVDITIEEYNSRYIALYYFLCLMFSNHTGSFSKKINEGKTSACFI